MESVYDMLRTLIEIIVINVVLSGDNAVVLALACRNLPARQQRLALLLGSVGVVVLMVILTAFAAYLVTLPYLELAGSVLLVWIGIKLLLPEAEDDGIAQSGKLFEAVKTIVIADIVMSLDNVLGMAGAAKGHLGMLVVGLTISIPLVLFGSALIVKLMERIPLLVTGGAGLLGWVAGEMGTGDPLLQSWIASNAPTLEMAVPVLGAAAVIGTGKLIARRRTARETAEPLAEAAAGSGASSGD